MRLFAFLLVALALLAPGLLSASSTAAAKLSVVSVSPLTVRGTGFRARERVTLLITAPGPLNRTVRASAQGAFSIRLGVRVGRCVAVVIQARGNRGSRATYSLDQPDCAPTAG